MMIEYILKRLIKLHNIIVFNGVEVLLFILFYSTSVNEEK